MSKKILFVSALSAELKIVKQEIKKLNISKENLEISFFECGMGNYKTILNLTRFLEKNNFDFIVNI
jgi:glutaredoxin-related protein